MFGLWEGRRGEGPKRVLCCMPRAACQLLSNLPLGTSMSVNHGRGAPWNYRWVEGKYILT